MSVRFLDNLERKGKGWNLTLQVLDGILCHDGEIHSRSLSPEPLTTFQEFDRKQSKKERNQKTDLLPATLEGCVVRLADTVAYIGKDIEDAIILNLIQRTDIPPSCRKTLGDTNGTIVYTLVTDLISNSDTTVSNTSSIGFSEHISAVLQQLKAFNYKHIYLAPETKSKTPLIRNCYRKLFAFYLNCLKSSPDELPDEIDLMADMALPHQEKYLPEEKVRDFIAGMTDDYFLKQAKKIGCPVPVKK
jgi:dGTPase